jgi:hypothetical protein
MAKDLTLVLDDRPGSLAGLGEALGRAGVNIDGVCGVTVGGKGEIHILVEDAAGARRALESEHIRVTGERDVLVLKAEDRPGELGRMARKLADAGVSIQLAYMATSTRIVFGVDNLEKARASL